MLTLQQFFNKAAQPDFFASFKILNFVTPVFHPLFFSCVREHAIKHAQRPVTVIDLAQAEAAHIRSQLEMSFLGNYSLFILDPGADLTAPEKELAAYLGHYAGSHQIILYTKPEEQLDAREGMLVVSVDAMLDRATYQQLFQFIYNQTASDSRSPESPFVQELFRRAETVPLDMAFIMLHYQQLLGRNSQQFFVSWFDRIIPPKKSLFLLSQYLFAGDVRRFYTAWHTLGQDYPTEFWVSFWAEQVWQAIVFVQAAKHEGPVAAKKHVSRLPFSFMQKDWQRFSIAQLVAAHNQLYQIDFAQKNGAITDGLELWYAQCFNN